MSLLVILVILVILQSKLLLGLNVLAASGGVLLVLLVMAVMITVLRLACKDVENRILMA